MSPRGRLLQMGRRPKSLSALQFSKRAKRLIWVTLSHLFLDVHLSLSLSSLLPARTLQLRASKPCSKEWIGSLNKKSRNGFRCG